MKTKNNTAIAYAALLVVFFFWGSVYVSNRYILQALTPMELACCRFIVSSLSLGGLLLLKKEKIQVAKEDRKHMFFIGFMGYFISMECTLLSVKYAGASLSSLINALSPVGITLFAAFFLKEKLTANKVFCLVVALIGVFIVSGGGALEGQFLGVLFGIGSIVSWAWVAMYIRRLSSRYDALVMTFLGVTISLIFHVPTALMSMAKEGVPQITPLIFGCILYSGFCGTAVAHCLWNYALTKLEASTCSMFYPLMPVYSTILGVLLLHEKVGPRFFIGGALIVSIVIISCLGGRKKTTE